MLPEYITCSNPPSKENNNTNSNIDSPTSSFYIVVMFCCACCLVDSTKCKMGFDAESEQKQARKRAASHKQQIKHVSVSASRVQGHKVSSPHWPGFSCRIIPKTARLALLSDSHFPGCLCLLDQTRKGFESMNPKAKSKLYPQTSSDQSLASILNWFDLASYRKKE